ncbi:MAG TPA: hypothetical protein VGB30_07630 [bacterium]|jgi:hypothetical protein
MSNPDSSEYQPTAYHIRIISWIVIAAILGLTAWVWVASLMMRNSSRFVSPDGDAVISLLLGYHIVLLIVTLTGYWMQVTWRSAGTTSLLPVSMLLGVVLLATIAVQIHLLVF